MATSRMGYFSAIGIAKESTWGTKVAPTLFLPGTSSVELTKQLIERPAIRKKRNPTKPVLGGWRAAGPVAWEADPENLGTPLALTFGSESVAQIGTNAYRHTYKLNSTSNPLPSFTLEEDKQEIVTRLGGGTVNRLTVGFSPGDLCRATMDCVFKADQTAVTAVTPTYSTRQPFHYGQTADMVVNGTSRANIRDWELSVDNALVAEKPTVDGGYYIKQPDVGRPVVSLRATAWFDDEIDYEMFWGAVDATGVQTSLSAYQLSLSISSEENISTSSLKYRLACVLSGSINLGAPVPISDPNASLMQTLTYNGYESGSGQNDAVVIELDDSQSYAY